MRVALTEIVDGAALVEYPDASEDDANRAAVALHRTWMSRPSRGILDAIPGARSLLAFFDPAQRSFEDIAREAAGAARRREVTARERRLLTVPVCYGGGSGPDLAKVAENLGVSAAAVAQMHAEAEYTVAFIGFSPGFPYLRGLPERLHAPRLTTPRTRVPAGSVGIGGSYTGIYPEETPGGWRLIGRAPVRLFDAAANPPALLRPGDSVRFSSIDEAELLRREAARTPPALPPPAGRALFRLLTPGLWSSVQGAPRFGLCSSGVPPGGAMDLGALAEGNAVLGNEPGTPALELTLAGAELEVLADCTAALVGAAIDAQRNGMPLAAGGPHAMRTGDRVRLGHTREGARSYLCVEGGLEEPTIGSKRLAAGDSLYAARRQRPSRRPLASGARPAGATLRFLVGPHADRFPERAFEMLRNARYRVSASSDRRGIRLEGEPVPRGGGEVPPEGTPLGAIQVPPDGLPILLGPDRPITGGYPRIGTVLPEDWPIAAQAAPGAELRFEAVGHARRLEPPPGRGSGG